MSISPSIKFSAPLIVDGSSLMSWLNRSPKGVAFTLTYPSWVTPVHDLGSYFTDSRGENKEMLIIPHKYTCYNYFQES